MNTTATIPPDADSSAWKAKIPASPSAETRWKRSFWSLFAVQFQGAFSDNLFKFLVVFIASATMTGHVRDQYISLILALFSLPFILFGMAGGFLADRFPKRSVVVGTKIVEIVIMALGTVGLALHSLAILLVTVFLMSTHSALFSPTKYSLLPEMLPESRLSWGNGLLGLGTFMAIILGGIVAGVLAEMLPAGEVWKVGAGMIGLALLGLWWSRGIERYPAANPEKTFRVNFFIEIGSNLKQIRKDRPLFLAVAGIVYFWFLGALFGEPTMLVYCQDVLRLESTQISLLRACLAVGIGVGSALAGFVSRGKIQSVLVPIGSLGLAVSSALMAVPGLSVVQFGILLTVLGLSGGFYTVPLNAIIQHRPDPKHKGSIIAAESWLTSVGVFAASGVFWLMKTALGLQPGSIFLIGSIATFMATIASMKLVPDAFPRVARWILSRTIHRGRSETVASVDAPVVPEGEGSINSTVPLNEVPRHTLHHAFIRSARRYPLRLAIADSTGTEINFSVALARVIFLARRLRPLISDDEMIGILLPPSAPAALTNLAVMLLGKVPVNLNYTLSPDALADCIRQAGIRQVISSPKVLERLKMQLPVSVADIEKVISGPRMSEKLAAGVLAKLCPAGLLERIVSGRAVRGVHDLATVIFSSGSTGAPKGVMLSHFNVSCNIAQLDQILRFREDDRFLGILPLFHSFGFTGNLAVMAIAGVGIVCHHNPTEAKRIGELIRKHRVTFLLATPTFLQFYTRGCEMEQFRSLRIVLVGAEKLHARIAEAFAERFGIWPLEAYGCTECAPAVTSNAPDFTGDGRWQIGTKQGTIGRPLPGVSVRIVDAETGAAMPTGQSGMMLVKGPNVMQGYLGSPERTREVLREGWYSTGDIASMDPDGFITITDRLSRFSKIGGEMVPHVKIEEHLQELSGETGQVFAVTGVPDEKRGERLMVLCRLAGDALAPVLEKLAASSLPNLWKPKRDQFVLVEQIPMLGTGKTDLRGVRELAAQAASVPAVTGGGL